ncbi:hypothetical protein DIPPA_27210 [Diplonema papillatum]|nr:hypothetical protein DIPPA_27210 [Diplonema papillatum]
MKLAQPSGVPTGNAWGLPSTECHGGCEEKIRMKAIEHVLGEMFQSMDGGWFQEWVDKFFADDLLFVVAGKLLDRSEDRSCHSKQGLVEYWNNVINGYYKDPSAGVEWDVLHEVQLISPETFTIDFGVKIKRDGSPVEHSHRRFTVSIRFGLAYSCMISPRSSDFDLDRDIMTLRSCVPTTPIMAPEAPCQHNSWDSIRAKNSFTMLRCRECDIPWKLHASQSHLFRCFEFLTETCPHKNEHCRRIHIYSRKRRMHERPAVADGQTDPPDSPVKSSASSGEAECQQACEPAN